MFTQGSTSIDRAQAGLGVGLALAQHLIRMHGGSITAYSGGVGKGSRFTVRLPVSHAAERGVASATQPDTAANTRRRILVVDDNHDFATSLAMILRDMGNDVRVEHDGLAGLRAAEAFQPALAFLDIGMPGMDGYQLARKLRMNERNRWIMLVAVTGWGQDSDKMRAREAGFDYHIVKPLDPTQLPAILSAAAHKSDMAHALPDDA
jgi:CheY-like chemotaxis protein